MKTLISIHIPSKSEVLVKVGDDVSDQTAIASVKKQGSTQIIEISKILNIHPQKISSFLKRKIGDKILKGDIIAEKKAFLSSMTIKSPADGFIEGLDLTMGSLALTTDSSERKNIYGVVSGKVKSVRDKIIEIECEAHEFLAEKSYGSRVHGRLILVKGDNVGVLDVPSELDKKIILVRSITDAAAAKVDALGVRGIIAEVNLEEADTTFAQVSISNFNKIKEFDEHQVVISPEDKKIYILK